MHSMPLIVSPKPRRAPEFVRTEVSAMPFMTPFPSQDLPLNLPVPHTVVSPPRLLSPVRLAEPIYRQIRSPPSCGVKPRRRGPLRISRSHCRRHSTRSDCQIEPFNISPTFDHLPWISALERSPDHLNIWDLGDLSQVVVEEPRPPCADVEQISGTGPIRQRKTSLRSNPLGAERLLSENSPSRRESIPSHFRIERPSISPRTPVSHRAMLPSQVRFHSC